MSEFLTHVRALCIKETRQIIRDKSAILLGIVLPVILIFLFGFGLSFDVQNIRLGIVKEQSSQITTLYTQAFRANSTFDHVSVFPSRTRAFEALKSFDIEAMVIFDSNQKVQLIIDGLDAPRATMVTNVVMQTMASASAAQGVTTPGVQIVPRIWFNEGAESRWYLVPGLMVIILTMTGTMLTGLVIAREWERGTKEALLATPVSAIALIASKTIPYFLLAMVGWLLCLLSAIFIYEIPVRGSLALITLSSIIYLFFCLGLGLMISAITRSQFLSSQITLLASFLPALLLSGFIFDLRSAPAWADILAHLLPPVYYLELLKVGFLTGGMTSLMIKDLIILTFFAVLTLAVSVKLNQKRVRK